MHSIDNTSSRWPQFGRTEFGLPPDRRNLPQRTWQRSRLTLRSDLNWQLWDNVIKQQTYHTQPHSHTASEGLHKEFHIRRRCRQNTSKRRRRAIVCPGQEFEDNTYTHSHTASDKDKSWQPAIAYLLSGCSTTTTTTTAGSPERGRRFPA